MRPEEWQRCVEIFSAALERHPEERAAFIDNACGEDESLRREVTILLRSHEESGDFISAPALAAEPELLGDDREALIGTRIGPYRVESVLGSGGMSVVYLAHDERLGRKVGLKLLPQSLIADMTHLSRLKREARTASALNHPNIVTIHDIGSDHSTHYIASELIEGETLRERLVRGPIQLSEAVDIAIQVTSALVAAHNAGVVHRDIKPENIMLRPDGYVKVLDFGIAKVAEQETPTITPTDEAVSVVETNLGSILGTARYMSPEQACPDTVGIDKRTDIWSLGVVFYEMATGHAPFAGDTPREVMSAILEEEPPPLTRYIAHAAAELQQIISKTLRKDREQRYQSAHELLHALKNFRRKLEAELERAAAPLWLRWIRSPAAVVLALLVAVLVLALPFYWHRHLTTSSPPEKSIAVLPFENLSRDPDNAYFAEGVQEEILTRLASIADLKVISHTSTQRYQSKRRNLREIAKQLGVVNILEGSVQKAADQVRVNVKLVNAQTDSHLWADSYDRKLTDILAVERELAKGIAESLQAKLTGREEQALAAKPTNNPQAYDAYLRGLAFEGRSSSSYGSYSPDLLGQAAGFFERAVQLDPNFALAWARLSHVNAHLYFSGGLQSTAAQRDTAKRALDNAQKLEPNSPETLLALGYYQYYVLGDYGLAKSTFRLVSKTLPSSREVPYALGRIARREGNWDESIAYFEQALTLDPRYVGLLMELAETYGIVRQFSAALKLYDRALDIVPNDPTLLAAKASIYQAQGSLQEAATFLSEINEQTPDDLTFVTKISQLRLERNYGEAVRLLQTRLAQFHFDSQDQKANCQMALALIQRLAGDTAGAKATAEQSRDILEPLYGDESRSPKARAHFAADLSQAYAAMGEKDSALKTAARAIILWPRAKDPKVGPLFEENLAIIQAIFGENSGAISTLTQLLQTPYSARITPALLRLDPIWDPLRADKRFEKILEESKSPVTLTTTLRPEKSVAVLPFIDLSEAKNQEYLCDGISEEILNGLAKVDGLRVVGRTSSFSFKGKNTNASEVGKKLNVENVLEGTLRREDSRVRITAKLINTRNGFHLWSETYERELEGVFALQDEITGAIVNALKVKLGVSLPVHEQRNTEAYELYLQGLYFSNKSGEEDLRRALSFFQRTVERDPTFSRAWTGISKVWYFLADVYIKPLEAYPLSREAAIKAIELDERDAEAHCYLSEAKRVLDWDLAGADAELKRALQLDPNSAPAHLFSGLHPLFRGEVKDGLRLVLGARKLDPVSPITSYVATAAYLANDRVDDAVAEGQRTLQLDPNYFYLDSVLAAAYRENKNFPEAITLYTKAQEATHLPSSGLAITYTRIGREIEAKNILAQLLQAREKRYVSAPLIAAVAVALGDKEGAFRELERAYAEHSGVLQWIAFLPEFRALRSDARFPHLLRRIGASQDTVLAITETTLSEITDPNALSHQTLKVGVKPRPGTQNGHARIIVSFYDRTKDNKMKPTDARTSYSWLNASEDWTDATPKFLVATYVRPKTQSRSADGREYGGFIVRVYFDGQLQDAEARPSELLTVFPAPDQLAPSPGVTP